MPKPGAQFVSEVTRAVRCLRTAAKDASAAEKDRHRVEVAAKWIERILGSQARRGRSA